jgi:hypothetical protein
MYKYFVPVADWNQSCTHAFVRSDEDVGYIHHIDGRIEPLECYRLDQAERLVELGLWREVSLGEARTWLTRRSGRDKPLTQAAEVW